MKKIALLLCLILCLGVLVSCKEPQKDKVLAAPPTEINIKRTFQLSKDVFIGKYLGHTVEEVHEHRGSLYEWYNQVDINVEVTEVFKGEYTPGQNVNFKLREKRFLDLLSTDGSDSFYLFMTGEDTRLDGEELSKDDKSYLKETDGVFRISNGSLININYKKKTFRHEIPESVETFLQEALNYQPLVNYLKESMGMTAVEVTSKAQNVFIGEIQCTIKPEEYAWAIINPGELIEGIKYDWTWGNYPNEFQLYKVKTKVLNVYKGDYKPGDIVESYAFVRNFEKCDIGNPYIAYMNEQLFIDGEGFFNK